MMKNNVHCKKKENPNAQGRARDATLRERVTSSLFSCRSLLVPGGMLVSRACFRLLDWGGGFGVCIHFFILQFLFSSTRVFPNTVVTKQASHETLLLGQRPRHGPTRRRLVPIARRSTPPMGLAGRDVELTARSSSSRTYAARFSGESLHASNSNQGTVTTLAHRSVRKRLRSSVLAVLLDEAGELSSSPPPPREDELLSL